MTITQETRERLLEAIADQVKEAELKLGYSYGTVRLYYRAESLCAALSIERTGARETAMALTESGAFAETPLGTLAFAEKQGRVEISVPPEGARYVHENVPEPPFLKAVIEFFRHHHFTKLEEIEALFARFSPDYVVERMPDGADFQYLMYFADPEVDAHYYCISDEMGHMTYHRYTKQDYLAITE